ncbi:DUF222 domain-containing protein [Gordonia amarae]|uniref:DUF222 domain-containing protein n=2 Tax=Gordonia amarae TaxID=36821 RepID=G7GQ92_9ACTN|nr:DUF222 domain-containing protein [Gordonia amarae]MCS3876730.1 hypothetical protein [Gordonia amarae]QHN15586.1 DUF222 domain-containing protein [Gordonia amarae]QHN20156.1 DUF222 domain-containing protein [Gordonia amarae]QHN29006.1 DUF222 domain-containing protein [Gordonia amarae]QHN37787.1 DUF222 domain-containing protein [Gordonia amarae]
MSSQTTIPADLSVTGSSVTDAYAQIHALLDHIAARPLAACSDTEILTAAEEHERAARRMASAGHRQIVELSDRDIPKRLGYRSLPNFLSHHLRITEPVRRQRQMEKLAQFHSATGELLPPRCPTLATAAAEGLIGPGHIHAVLEIFEKIPTTIDHDIKLAAEATLGELACDHTPAEITTLGMRLLAHLDPDGDLTDDTDRARQRNLWINRQNVQKMSKLTGHLDPVTRAMLDTLLSSWAAPGMNIPGDPESSHCSPWTAATAAPHPDATSPPPTTKSITPPSTSPQVDAPTSPHSPAPAPSTIGWSAPDPANTPPRSPPTAGSADASSGPVTPTTCPAPREKSTRSPISKPSSGTDCTISATRFTSGRPTPGHHSHTSATTLI